MKWLQIIIFVLFLCGILTTPEISFAQNPQSFDSQIGEDANRGQFVPCSGTSCSACHLVQLANNVIDWLIGILATIFAILAVVSGIRLVVSGGNESAKTSAKSTLTNAFIGLLIVLGAWLLIDTLMRALVGDNGQVGSAPWGEIECWAQRVSQQVTYKADELVETNRSVAGVEITYACQQKNNVWDCSASKTKCENLKGTAVEKTASDGERKYVVCTFPPTANYGSCEPITSTANPCHAKNLEPYFGARAAEASIICSKESGGTPVRSKSDICCGSNGCQANDPSFSGGYFQINILAHADKIPNCEPGKFYKKNGTDGVQGNCVRRNSEGVCTGWSCQITDVNMYKECMKVTYDSQLNLKIAKQLYDDRGGHFNDWSWSAKRCNVSL